MTEVTELHTGLLRSSLRLDEARAWWSNPDLDPDTAFADYTFGARSHERVRAILADLRLRFDAWPHALAVLRAWPDIGADTRTAICHWHLQLVDPLYRAFTGEFLPNRRGTDPTVSRPVVARWVADRTGDRWGTATLKQFATKLLGAAREAGLVDGRRDPRRLTLPRVPDDALAYLLYLLRDISFEGTLADNPYLRSVGLSGATLDSRLRTLPDVDFHRLGSLSEFGWRHPDLRAWNAARHPGAA